jgi:hypothetical protein
MAGKKGEIPPTRTKTTKTIRLVEKEKKHNSNKTKRRINSYNGSSALFRAEKAQKYLKLS